MSVELRHVPGRQTTPFYHHMSVATGQRVVHIAGQVGSDENLQLVDGGLAAQAEQALRNVVSALRAAGATPADLVKMTIYVVDIKNNTEVWRARREFFTGDFPASTLVEVRSLAKPEVLVEIEAVAYLGSR